MLGQETSILGSDKVGGVGAHLAYIAFCPSIRPPPGFLLV